MMVSLATLPAAAFRAALHRLKPVPPLTQVLISVCVLTQVAQALACALLLTLCFGLTAQTLPPRNLSLVIGKGQLLQFNNDVSRVVLAEPKIADAVVVGPREVMV